MILEFKSRKGLYLEKLSEHPTEKELLLNAGSRFRVVKRGVAEFTNKGTKLRKRYIQLEEI